MRTLSGALALAVALIVTGCDTQPTATLVSDPASVARYLDDLSGLGFDLNTRIQEYEEENYQEFVDEQGQPVPPPVEYMQGIWIERIAQVLRHLNALEAMEVPSVIVMEHGAYVEAQRSLFTRLRADMEGFTTIDEFTGYFFESFEHSPRLTPDQRGLLVGVVETCQELESRVTEILDEPTMIGCPDMPTG